MIRLTRNIRVWILSVLAFCALLSLAYIAEEVLEIKHENDQELLLVDQTILDHFTDLRTPLLTQAMTDITALGSVSVIIVLSSLAISLLLAFRDHLGIYHLL